MLVLQLALLDIFVDNMDKKTWCTPRNSGGDTKLSCAVHTLKGSHAVQMDLKSLETQAYENLIEYYKVKCLTALLFSTNMCLK